MVFQFNPPAEAKKTIIAAVSKQPPITYEVKPVNICLFCDMEQTEAARFLADVFLKFLTIHLPPHKGFVIELSENDGNPGIREGKYILSMDNGVVEVKETNYSVYRDGMILTNEPGDEVEVIDYSLSVVK